MTFPVSGLLSGGIGANTGDQIANWLASASRDYANTLTINSHGGNAVEALAAANLIRNSRIPVHARLSRCESGAYTIASACRELRVFSDTAILLHRTHRGDHYDADCRQLDELTADFIAACRGIPKATILTWMRACNGLGTRFTAQQAIDAGLADSRG